MADKTFNQRVTTAESYPGAGIAVSTGSAWGTSKTSPSGTIIGTTDTQTLTNKRITRRNVTVNAPTNNYVINTDDVDIQTLTGITQSTFILNPTTGTPVDGDRLEIRLLDNGTSRSVIFSSTSFASSGTVSIPSATVINVVLRIYFEYSTVASLNKWVCVAKA